MAIGGVIINVVLNYILIRSNGVEGAALATLITQSVTALVQIIVAYRIFKFKFSINYYSSLIGLLAGLLIGYFLLIQFSGLENQLIIPYFLAGVILAFLLGIFKIQDLKTILTKND